MKEKAICNILTGWFISAITICISKKLLCRSDLYGTMNGILAGISIIAYIALFGIAISCLRCIRESNKKFLELWEKGDINACISFAENELNKNIARGFVLNTKRNLVMAYYRIGDSSTGRKLLYETKWGNYKEDVLYFFVLDCLADGDLLHAKQYYRQLCHSWDRRKRQPQIEICRRLLNNMTSKTETEASAISSIYPIVEEILKKTAK